MHFGIVSFGQNETKTEVNTEERTKANITIILTTSAKRCSSKYHENTNDYDSLRVFFNRFITIDIQTCLNLTFGATDNCPSATVTSLCPPIKPRSGLTSYRDSSLVS